MPRQWKPTRGKPDRKYRPVNIPLAMYEAIQRLVTEGRLPGGYVSADDFIRDALRERLRELGYLDRQTSSAS